MLRTDEDALICDLAETYHIYDWRSCPVRFIAALACGLPSNSRIMRAINEQPVSDELLLMAVIADGINWLVWSKTKDAENGWNKPKSIYERLMSKGETSGYSTSEEFEAARAKILGG